ncbi:MAG TPA: DNA-3-methyladenine glycosylase [Cytophagales bacterium]|jgi:DNA-3-methyladenine glycosylase|nr:DNA-3-methyladenine glycosylase [Cytophagales bacterium]
MADKLPRSFYEREDVVQIARELLGKRLCTHFDGVLTSAIITEVEAYCGRNDKACHANDGLRTNRTEVMYGRGGHAYVYLCYGIHHLFNVVTNKKHRADAILVRGVSPEQGIETMLQRRSMHEVQKRMTSGPGTLSQALGIRTKHTGCDLMGNEIWIEEQKTIPDSLIVESRRIGVDYSGDHAFRPWRFYIKESKWVSKP